jgi:hypothetical protein
MSALQLYQAVYVRVANERKQNGMGIYPFPIMSLTLLEQAAQRSGVNSKKLC